MGTLLLVSCVPKPRGPLAAGRNSEHILGPGGSIPGRNVWYFTDSIVGSGPGGEPKYVVDIRDTSRSAEELFEALRDFLGPEAVMHGDDPDKG